MRVLRAAVLFVAASAVAQVPPKVGYQGRLLKSDGSPEAGIVSLSFLLYASATGGATLGCDAQQVALADGFYSVLLGDVGGCFAGVPAISMAAFDGRDLYLEVAVSNNPLAPRQRIVSVPYAQRAGAAVNVRGGTVEATSVTVGGAGGVSVTGSGIAVGGTTIVDASGKATVATGSSLTGNGTSASPLAVAFGTTAGAAAEGNDPRLSDARDPKPGSASYIQNNSTATAQTASFNIAGNAVVGGNVGIGTATPGSTLDVDGALSIRGMTTAPAVAPAGQGRIYFDPTAGTFKASKSGGAASDLDSNAGTMCAPGEYLDGDGTCKVLATVVQQIAQQAVCEERDGIWSGGVCDYRIKWTAGSAAFAGARDLCVAEFGTSWTICSLADFVSELGSLRKRGMPDSIWVVPSRSDMMDPNGSLFGDNTPGWQGQAASSVYTAIYSAGRGPCVYLGKGNATASYHTIAPHWGCGAASASRVLCCRT